MNLLGSWAFVSSSSWSWPERESLISYKNYVALEEIPSLVSVKKHLEADGYKFDRKPVRILRHESTKDGTKNTSFKILHTAYFIKEDGKLSIVIEGKGYQSVEEATINALARTEDAIYHGEPVKGGKGQLKRCREIARRLLDEHGGHLGQGSRIIVSYRTRGGRGGWKEKVARRTFSIEELYDQT